MVTSSHLLAFCRESHFVANTCFLGLFCADFYADICDLTQILPRYLDQKSAAGSSACFQLYKSYIYWKHYELGSPTNLLHNQLGWGTCLGGNGVVGSLYVVGLFRIASRLEFDSRKVGERKGRLIAHFTSYMSSSHYKIWMKAPWLKKICLPSSNFDFANNSSIWIFPIHEKAWSTWKCAAVVATWLSPIPGSLGDGSCAKRRFPWVMSPFSISSLHKPLHKLSHNIDDESGGGRR